MENEKFIQLHDSYIITELDEGFAVIDQHALHERIKYEQLKKRITANCLESQKLLIPESFEVNQIQSTAIEQNKEMLKKLGIELVSLGTRKVPIETFLVLLQKVNPTEFVTDMIDLLVEKDKNLEYERLLDEILNMAACKAAIKANQRSIPNSSG